MSSSSSSTSILVPLTRATTVSVGVVTLLPLLLFLLRTVQVLYNIQTARRNGKSTIPICLNDDDAPLQTVVVLGSGGHTTEMLTLLRHLNDDNDNNNNNKGKKTTTNQQQEQKKYNFIYIKAATDTTSLQRLESMMNQPKQQQETFVVYDIPRSREVGQSYLSSIVTTLYAQWHAMALVVFQLRPRLILTNGPGTALPICVAGLLLRILGVVPVQIVFCESYCRVQTLSLTGKLLYPLADLFIVHWKELQKEYPLTHCVNSFVQSSS